MAHNRNLVPVKRQPKNQGSLITLQQQLEDLLHDTDTIDQAQSPEEILQYVYKSFSVLANFTKVYSQTLSIKTPSIPSDNPLSELEESYFNTVEVITGQVLNVLYSLKSFLN